MHQFHDFIGVDPKNTQDLSYEQLIKSLEYLILLILKNAEVTIKGIGCADVINKRDWLSKEDTSSLTVSTKGLMLS